MIRPSHSPPHLRNLFPTIDSLTVLDVGAGPLTSLGTKADGVHIALRACDPLASVYRALLEKNGIIPPVRTEFSTAEDLSSFFEHESFDIVHCQNALDHSADPMRGIQQMLKICKLDGAVYLTHYRNEAETESYEGFHQWNFDIQDGKFVIWNKQNRIDVESVIQDGGQITSELRGGAVVVVIRKKTRVIAQDYDETNERLKSVLQGFIDNLCLAKVS